MNLLVNFNCSLIIFVTYRSITNMVRIQFPFDICFALQLDYKVTVAKLEEIFKIAGNVIEVDLKTDKEGKSRGMGTVRFEHPIEAVQAIGLFFHICY